jgi:hypothetical protein
MKFDIVALNREQEENLIFSMKYTYLKGKLQAQWTLRTNFYSLLPVRCRSTVSAPARAQNEKGGIVKCRL